MFEGEYKSRPRVSLRGASKKEKRSSLIHRNQAEREKREGQRKKEYSALKIQAFVRGCWSRKHEYDIHRHEFDKILSQVKEHSEANINLLLRHLLFFYSVSKDYQRLISMCQLLLRCVHNIVITDHKTWVFQLKYFLTLCSGYLERAIETQAPFAVPLRAIETFTSPNCHHLLSKESLEIILIFLVKNGYFKHLRTLMEKRIPSSLDISSGVSTPLGDTIVDLLMRPVSICCTSLFGNTSEVLCTLASVMFVPRLSDQIKFFLLPKLQSCKLFPFYNLLESFKRSSFFENYATPELLYCVLTLAQTYFGTLKSNVLSVYIETLLHGVRSLSSKVEKSSVAESIESGEEDDDDDRHDDKLSQVMEDGESSNVIADCLDLLNGRSHVQLLSSSFSSQRICEQTEKDECVKLLSLICHDLIIEQKSLIHETRLLLTLAFNKVFLRKLWHMIKTVSLTISMGKQMYLIDMIISGQSLRSWEAECISPLFVVFSNLFRHLLFSLHDTDFRGSSSDHHVSTSEKVPFTLQQLPAMVKTFCDVILGVIDIITREMNNTTTTNYSPTHVNRSNYEENPLYGKGKWNNMLNAMTNVLKQLYSRDTRLHYCPENHWLSSKVNLNVALIDLGIFFVEEGDQPLEAIENRPGTSGKTFFQAAILEHIPFVIPFVDRVKLFQRILNEDKRRNVGDLHNFLMGPSIEVRIRRNSLYQDAFDELGGDQNLKQKIHVKLINPQGLEEAGVDGGGLFREFLNECLKAGFDENIGVFSSTKKQLLYPNPQAHLVERDVFKHYYFLGRMLGKAIYENMLVELPFADFFLCKLLGKSNADVDINNLESLDPEMYKNLLFLKNCPNVEDLTLNFTAVNDNLGDTQVVELKPGGKDVVVTNQNRIEYIHLMADYKLNRQIRPHCNAFRSGLSSVIDTSWLRMFDHHELQMLISGAEAAIDLEDMKMHTAYSGTYNEEHRSIKHFWEVISGFTDVQRRQLLKFVTSCSRPPLLGFKDLHPPFTIHTAGSGDRLPSASTCVHLLKLPEYKDALTMRDRLLYSIESGAGFELS